jgi:16S rRNA (uracil1498-N3)-methyltransferase
MTRRRWIADEVSGNQAALKGTHADHLIRVLRARVGQEFDIAVEGIVRRGRIIRLGESRVDFELGQEMRGDDSHGAVTIHLTLVLAIYKFDRLEWAIEKCTELGAARIVPLIARRTDAHLASASAKRVERWRKISRQAAEQSRRALTPEIDSPVRSKDLSIPENALRILLNESEHETALRGVLVSHEAPGEIVLAIGPEGGWTEDEIEAFEKSGWISASLGPTILRAETAAIAATAVVISEDSKKFNVTPGSPQPGK